MIDPEVFLRTHPVREAASDSTSEAPDGIVDASDDIAEERESGVAAALDADERVDRCMSSALKSLDAAGASVEGLRRRLKSKDYEDETIEKVLSTLVRMQLLDDEAFARGILTKCLRKMMGASATRREMHGKGIDSFTASRIVKEAEQQGDFEESASRLVESVARKTAGMDYEKRMRRLIGAAQRKGHSASAIMEYGRSLIKHEEADSENFVG